MRLVLLTGDLAVGAKLSSMARQGGIQCEVALSLEQLEVALRSSAVDVLVIDLDRCLPTSNQLQSWRELCKGGLRIVAFGPHVHADKLAAAREAGCDHVVSRGQIQREFMHLYRPG